MNSTIHKTNVLVVSLALAPLLAGCDAKLQSYVGDLDDAVQNASTGVSKFYVSTNDIHRNLYLMEVRIRKAEPLLPEIPMATVPNSKLTDLETIYRVDDKKKTLNTGLLEYYPDDYVQARAVAFQFLSKFTSTLKQLASSTSADEAKTAVSSLSTDMASLASQLQKLDNKTPKLDISKFSTPIANFTGLAAKGIISAVIDHWVRQAVTNNALIINNVCQELEDDTSNACHVVLTRTHADVTEYERYFDDPANKLVSGDYSSKDKADFLQDMATLTKLQDDLASNDPSALLHKVTVAEQKLITYICPTCLSQKVTGEVQQHKEE